MKKLLVLLLLPVVAMAADKLTPLRESVDRLASKNGEPDLTELAYVGIRSAALYTEVVSYFQEGARNSDDKKAVEPLKAKAVTFYTVGLAVSIRTGKSAENVEKQMKMLLAYYSEEMRSGKLLNNNAITEIMQADMKAAGDVFPLFQQFLELKKAK